MDGVGNRNIATASEARIALAIEEKVFIDVGATSSSLTGAIRPLFGLRWNREVRQMVGAEWVSDNMRRLRNSNRPPEIISNSESCLNVS